MFILKDIKADFLSTIKQLAKINAQFYIARTKEAVLVATIISA